MDYKHIRQALLAQRRSIPKEDLIRRSAQLRRHFSSWFNRHVPPAESCTVAAFAPIREEPDLLPLLSGLHDQGHRIGLPVIESDDAPLAFYEWQPGTPLLKAKLGTLEPPRNKRLTAPHIMLAPMLAYGPQGERMGYGGGYYDRTIQALRNAGQTLLVIGVTWDDLRLPDTYAPQPHDQPVDGVLTEEGLKWFRPAAQVLD